MSKDTHKLMLEHSQAKVKLYGSYLTKYLRVITRDRYTTDIHLYDMFCGEGIYDGEAKGSPVIALEALQGCYAEERTLPTFHITFNDIDENIILKLKENLKKVYINQDWVIRFWNDDYLNLLSTVRAEIGKFKKEKAVVFLDPKGYKEIIIEHIKQLLLSDKSEVLVFLPIRDMHRFANMSKSEISSGHEPLYKFISEVFPKGIPKFESQIDFINKVREGFKNILPGYFVDTFILEREPGQFFCLFFFTSHIRGFEKMLEAKWEMDEEQGRIWRYERSETMFTGSEVLNFSGKMKEFLSKDKRYNSQLYSFCLHEGFLPKHANEILRDWQQKNEMNVFNSDGSEARRTSFYLSYDDFKNEPQKVYYNIPLTLF